MALITSAATGNFNAGATWTGGVVPGVGDEARASNGHTITITADVTCDEVSNAGTGIFTLNDGVTLTANVTSKSTTTSRNCLQFTAASPAAASIVGNITGGTVASAVGVAFTSTGTLNITGNLTAGSGAVSHAVNQSSTGVLNVTGNCNGGSSSGYGINSVGANTINVTGNANGSSGANFSIGILFNGTLNLTGNATGGSGTTSSGVYNNGAGLGTITGIATGGTAGGIASAGAHNQSTGTIIVTRIVGNAFGPGNTVGLASVPGANNVTTGIIQFEEMEFGAFGQSPNAGTGFRLKKVSTNVAVFNYVDSGSAKTLVDATQGQMPAEADVRDGVSYASGALTGTCKVPAAASVAFGVPVDATTGTAALTPASVWDHLLTAITTSSTIGTLLKTNIDATISSRSTATTAGTAIAVWNRVLTGATHNVPASAGRRLRILDEERIIADGQVVSATTSGITLQPIGSLCVGQTIVVTSDDTGEKQTRFILAYDSATNTASVDTQWCNIPQAGDEYLLTTVRDPLVTRNEHPAGTVGAEIDEQYLLQGLKVGETLTVTPTSRTAGAIAQTIGGDGTTTTTVSRD
jgi:hypothetical protein